jgi:UDP:flavonoid glycosyltransferase YjiC (YdhE family)
MKILMASTPATGHVNPLVTIARFLVEDGHEVVFHSGTEFRRRVETSGARFQALLGKADVDFRDLFAVVPELAGMQPGFDRMRVARKGVFIDRLADQHLSLRRGIEAFQPEVIVSDDMFFGLLPMLLGSTAHRPPVILCGTSILHCRRPDGAPNFLGLPPATTSAELEEYKGIAVEYREKVDRPSLEWINAELKALGANALATPVFEAIVSLADTYLQLSVPSFEFPRDIPSNVNFIGALPIVPNQAPLPSWAADVDGGRKVVLVTQGTVANHDFGLLVGPTLAALASEPDILVVATGGGRSIDAIPFPTPPNARLAEYLPFEWLLPRTDVLVTNGGYGSVNQSLSFGIPIVAAGLTEDKADVNARIGWSGVGINLKTNDPSPDAIRAAVRKVLDEPDCWLNAQRLAAEFATFDTRREIPRLVRQCGDRSRAAA